MTLCGRWMGLARQRTEASAAAVLSGTRVEAPKARRNNADSRDAL